MNRVVVTGIGVISPLGVGSKVFWEGIVQGRSAIRKLKCEEFSKLSCRIGGKVDRTQFDRDAILNRDERRTATPAIEFALAATQEAIDDSEMDLTVEDLSEVGVCIGSGMGCMETLEATHSTYVSHGPRKVSPFFVPKVLINMASGIVSARYKFQGPCLSTTTACSAGAHAIGEAFNLIRLGHAHTMVAGGTESCITPLTLAGFVMCKALTSKFNDNPEKASRPFDRQRSGFVMGEGSGIVILEERGRALARGAKIYGELVGYGLSGDAFHITAPPEDGNGARLAMKQAFRNLDVQNVSYINAHATSTPLGDRAEMSAITSIFSNQLKTIPISSIKGSTGHLLGASGAVEAVASILSLKNKVAPPNTNLEDCEFESPGLDFITEQTPLIIKEESLVVSNSFGFGGTNACLVFQKHS